MNALPLPTKLLLAWLCLVTLLPAFAGVMVAADAWPQARLTFALIAAVLAALIGLLLFEPPRSLSARRWLLDLQRRLVPGVQPSPSSKEQ